jgi:hypothetical protein
MGMSACKSVVINLEIVQVQVRFKDWWSGPSGVPLRRTFRSPGCFARRPNAERLDRLLPVIIYCKAGLGDKENERQSISQNVPPSTNDKECITRAHQVQVELYYVRVLGPRRSRAASPEGGEVSLPSTDATCVLPPQHEDPSFSRHLTFPSPRCSRSSTAIIC